MKFLLLTVLCSSVYLFTIADARVSRSFKRGYLLGYAKGLDDGRRYQHVVHACDLHGLPEPESHSEPIHEPHGHSSHGYEHGYSASNSHATNSINSPSINSKITSQVKSTGSLLPSLAAKESRLHITALRPLEKLTASATEALEKAVKEYFRA